MTTTLVTGSSQGLGRETARQLTAAGHMVWVTSPDAEGGARAAEELGARFVQLDVTSAASVAAAREELLAAGDGLDVLVNNAGTGGGFTPIAEVTAEAVQEIYEVNVFGAIRVTQHLIPLLERSRNAVVVNVSSGMGSFGVTSDSARMESTLVGLAYPSSKAALNMLTTMYAKAYPHMRINSVDPGQTRTEMTDGRGLKSVEQGARVIVQAASFGESDASGAFFDEDGPLPW